VGVCKLGMPGGERHAKPPGKHCRNSEASTKHTHTSRYRKGAGQHTAGPGQLLLLPHSGRTPTRAQHCLQRSQPALSQPLLGQLLLKQTSPVLLSRALSASEPLGVTSRHR
jgi:hypothetical protein